MKKSLRKKKIRVRSQLTHFEVRRGGSLLLRLAIADNSLAGVGDELGALFRKIAPSAVSTRVVAPSASSPGAIEVVSPTPPSEFVVAPQHTGDDDAYHASLHDRLSELIGSLCDASLDDALEIAREERSRRAEGGN